MTSILDDVRDLASYFNVKSYIQAFKDGAKAVDWPVAKMRLEDTIDFAIEQNAYLNDIKERNPAFYAQRNLEHTHNRIAPVASIDMESEEGKAITLTELDQLKKTTQETKNDLMGLSVKTREFHAS